MKVQLQEKTLVKVGDWLLDVAKYIFTAILLSALFSGVQKWYGYAFVFFLAVVTFLGGVFLINRNRKEKKL